MGKLHECNNCILTFTSEYLLNKHLNRKTPCTIILKCKRCNKHFKSERYLLEHINRKTPCILAEVKSESVDDKIKLMEAEAKIQVMLLETKSKLEKEKIKAKSKLEKEKSDARKEIEKIKNERKISNSQIINNGIIQNIVINAPTINVINATPENCLNLIVKPLLKKLSKSEAKRIFDSSEKADDISVKIIKDVYNNNNHPNFRNMLFKEQYNLFYVVMGEEWVLKNYDYINTIISETLKQYLDSVLKYIKAPRMDSKEFIKYQDLIIYQNSPNKFKNNLEKISKNALDETNAIEKTRKKIKNPDFIFSDSDLE